MKTKTMKARVFQTSTWFLVLTLGLVACCKRDDVEKPDDPYSNITEGRVLIPVLAHKVDMKKVESVEGKRGGTLAKLVPADPKKR
ncbi:MAG: hypothetical protein Q3998_06915 [Porphyromonas sp.]|nr:hypothetical protein [Porphyromonas sp.]